MRIVDYSQIRLAFVIGKCNEQGQHTYPTLKELAEEYDLSHSNLAHRASEEGWMQQRQQTQDRIVERAFEQFEGEMSSLLAQVDRQVARVSMTMINVIEESLANAETPQEKQALTARYSKMLPDILSAAHSAIGVERALERASQIVEAQENEQK